MDKCKDLPTPLCWAILERVSEGFVLLDKKLHVMWANVAAEKLLGASYDKLKIGGQLPFFDEVNAAHFAQMVSNLFSSPSFSEGMLLFRIGIDKMYLHVRVSLEQWNDATYYIVKIEDPLKSAQDAVIVNLGVHLGIVEMVDSKHLNSISMNEYTLSSTGFTKYNIAEQDCAKVFRYDPNSSTNVWSSMYKQILETKKPQSCFCLSPKDNARHLMCAFHFGYSPKGNPLFGFASRDITEVWLAKESSEAKSSFLAGVSHELRNPLNGVVATASALAETPLNSQQRDFVDMICSSGQTLIQAVNDILDFVKAESTEMNVNKQLTDLADCLDQAIDVVIPSLIKKNLPIYLDIKPGTITKVVTDGARLVQILINLLSNAIKFTEKGHITLKISSEPKDQTLIHTFVVIDTGIGVSEEAKQNLFNPFYQEHRTQNFYGGTGLGLAICKKLVSLLGGEISLESNSKGPGTSFFFTISSVLQEEKSHKRKQKEEIEGPKICVVPKSEFNMGDNRDLDTLRSFAQLLELHHVHITSSEILSQENAIILAPVEFASKLDPQSVKNLVVYGGQTSPPHPHFLPSPFRLRHFKHVIDTLAPNISKRHQSYDHLSALIVDDSDMNQKVLVKILKTAGIESTYVASTGMEALDILRKSSPVHLVFMDVNLPGMDGFECVQVMQKQFHNFNPLIVILTGSSTEEIFQQAAALNVSVVLKPIHLHKVREILQQCDQWIKSRSEFS